MNSLSLEQLSKLLDAKYIGDPNYKVTTISPLERATENSLSFIVNPNYENKLKNTKTGILVTSNKQHKIHVKNILLHENPYYIYAKISQLLKNRQSIPLIHKSAVIEESAKLGKNCQIYPNVTIGQKSLIGNNVILMPGVVIGDNVTIRDNSILHANVSVYDNVKIGNDVKIHANTVVGSDGFGFAPYKDTYYKIEHLGTVIIKDNVEIGSNTSIDKGALDNTIIESGVKIDNLVQIAHNVQIGKNTVIAGKAGIAGSTVIGKNCQLGGAVNIVGHISICDNVIITGSTSVGTSIVKPGIYSSGLTADKHSNWKRNVLIFKQLYLMRKEIKLFKKQQKSNT